MSGLNLGLIASMCLDCSKCEDSDSKCDCKMSLLRSVNDTLNLLINEHNSGLLCCKQYFYWKGILEKATSLCVLCETGSAVIHDELCVYIRKDALPALRADLKIVSKKKGELIQLVKK